MSLRAYARHRGVSLRAVQKAIQSGRIRAGEDGRIDAEAADGDWERNTAPRPKPMPHPERSSLRPAAEHRVVAAAAARESLDSTPRLDNGGLEYSRARAVHETYRARLARVEFEERSGKLVSRDEVQVAAFTRFRTFRDGMLNIADRLAAVLAAETDPAQVHQLLTAEIRKALLEFSDANNG